MALIKEEQKNQKKYKGVTRITRGGRYVYYVAKHTFKGENWQVTMNTAREAALAYDKRLIQCGLQPINILKPLNR